MEDYYIDNDKKIKDYYKGFLGVFAVFSLTAFIIQFRGLFYFYSPLVEDSSLLFIISLLELIVLIVIIVIAFKKNRRYIGIGMISALLIPLLIVGACLGVASVVIRGI